MPKITFLKTGQTFEVPAGTRFLEFCQENDAPHDFGCTVGSCGTCCCVLTEGAGEVNEINDEEREMFGLQRELISGFQSVERQRRA